MPLDMDDDRLTTCYLDVIRYQPVTLLFNWPPTSTRWALAQAWAAMRDEQRILDRALSLHHEGKIADAARLYRRIINVNPHNLHAIHFLGVAEAAAGNIDRAKTLIDRSLQS